MSKTITRNGLLAGALALLILGGCSTAPIVENPPPEEPVFSHDRVLQADSKIAFLDLEDPWEGFNRRMYVFNTQFDRYVFLPVLRGYHAITTETMRKGVTNFFGNIRDITNFTNAALQGKFGDAGHTAARFAWNTTAGLLGFIDVATPMGIPEKKKDFGMTLGRWGVGPGPYLVIPILGPSTVRDGIGWGVDTLTTTFIRDELLNPNLWQKMAWGTISAIDQRDNIAFRYYETGSPFEYAWVRWLYSMKRKLEIGE